MLEQIISRWFKFKESLVRFWWLGNTATLNKNLMSEIMQMSKILINAYGREYNLKRGGTQFVEFHTNWFEVLISLTKWRGLQQEEKLREKFVSWRCGEEASAAVVSESSLQPLWLCRLKSAATHWAAANQDEGGEWQVFPMNSLNGPPRHLKENSSTRHFWRITIGSYGTLE